MKQRIVSIAIHPTAFTIAVIYALIAAVVAIIYVVVAVWTAGPRALFILLAPVVYFVIGYLTIAIAAWIYNQVAPRTGGVGYTVAQDMPDEYEPPGTAGAAGFQV